MLLDTDLGPDVADAFALALLFGSMEFEPRGLTSVGGDADKRAVLLCRFCTMTGRRHVPVAPGLESPVARSPDARPLDDKPLGALWPYYYHPDALFGRVKKPETAGAVEFLHGRLRAQPGEVALAATGPLTNVAKLLADHPDAKSLPRRIVCLESNLARDPAAARAVLASGASLVIVTEAVARELTLTADQLQRVFASKTALSLQVEALIQMADQPAAPLGDAFAVALCADDRLAAATPRAAKLDESSQLRLGEGTPNARLVDKVDAAAFVKFYVEHMAALVAPADKPSELVDRGNFPLRVHVAEDFDTDIERRWWMSGKPERALARPGGARACRGVLTHDFDDLLMASRAMYTAVIFNPVPGPPMSGATRLSFRYWLRGTDTLRVQIYSLTNGHHRHLVTRGLPQGAWREATVDLTQARRPDGTGGPLGRDERIDDIQFYVDPRAEVIIDDIVLYEAAPPDERRPFPRRVVFTGGFDTGQQGKEWPGVFEIVAENAFFWKAARAIDNPDLGGKAIRVNLRGERPLSEHTDLTFRYRLTGAKEIKVALVGRDGRLAQTLAEPALGAWRQATLRFEADKSAAPREGDEAARAPTPATRVEEIHFVTGAEADLLVDDILLYEP